jgi:threonine aldolase
MARRLASSLEGLPGLRLAYPVQSNGVFAEIGRKEAEELQQDWSFHVWAEAPGDRCVVRWMTAFDTGPEDVDSLVAAVRAALVSRET